MRALIKRAPQVKEVDPGWMMGLSVYNGIDEAYLSLIYILYGVKSMLYILCRLMYVDIHCLNPPST